MEAMENLIHEFPLSVEEAGALLGATITRCGKETFPLISPPKGMHSSFATTLPVPSSEILNRLYDLRALLRSTPSNEPMTAAPSLLAVLVKVIGVSTSLAAASGQPNPAVRRLETPPLFSTPLRKLWVDCVVLCHVRGVELTGISKIDTTQFIRRMLGLAATHPRSGKAAGGVRIAALEVVGALLLDETNPKIAAQLAPWTLEIFQMALKALRSAGNGEPTYRIAAVRMAGAAAIACRRDFMKTRGLQGNEQLVIQGGMEDKAIHEAVKILKQAVIDKFPEVRSAAATFAASLSPFLFLMNAGPDVALMTTCLDDVMHLAMKNLDDESPFVSDGWADVVARCMCTSLQYHEQHKAASSSDDREETDDGDGKSRSAATSDVSNRYGSRKNLGLFASFTSVKNIIGYLVEQFIKVGGELAAVRAGGAYSIGGRSVRMGYTLAMTKFVGLQYELGSIGDGRLLTIREIMVAVLAMAGPEVEKQVQSPVLSEGSGSVTPLFGGSRTWSKNDSLLVRVYTSRVLRRGLVEIAPEPVQILILQAIADLLGTPTSAEHEITAMSLNSYQTQVVVIEISHLMATLGDAAQSKVGEITECLRSLLSHDDIAVRHEAAVAFASLVNVFPSEGRKTVWELLGQMQEHHAQLVSEVSPRGGSSEETSGGRFFRRTNKAKTVDPMTPHRNAVHGVALMVSLILKILPRLPGGLPVKLLSTALSAAEALTSCRKNDVLCSMSPASVCVCVNAGFSILSGVLATGAEGVVTHTPLIFKAWQTAYDLAKVGTKGMEPRHDLVCIDSVLSSIVVFLKFDSELLLTIPEALTHVTMLLEGVLKMFLSLGRFGTIDLSSRTSIHLDSAKASLLEGFTWLPCGTFPMAADEVFRLAGSLIREAIESDVTCSILPSMVNREDRMLDAKTFSRAKLGGQVGGSLDLEETMITLNADVALHTERESISLLIERDSMSHFDAHASSFRGSLILGKSIRADHSTKPPTPLHEVGTWRRPLEPSCASKVRLADAAIQAFASTFGLKSGQEQQEAMDMLESLVPPLLMQLARSLGMTAALTDQNYKSKAKEDSSAVENITAVILSCLQVLPLHDSTHNVPIRLCPPWMNKAKELLLTLLPSPSTVVRRASAEGLALLATVGVSEDGHFLQSSVLHSLDEVMQGNKPDGKPRSLSLDSISAARAGSLLTLAFIQRTNYTVTQRKRARAMTRGKNERIEDVKTENNLPVLQMMTRILPSVACHGRRDYFTVRTSAMHAFAILVAYSARLDTLTLDAMQLLRKGVELIEENFASSWTASSADNDRGQEAEKMSSEVSFLAVLLRFMTSYLPYITALQDEDRNIARRFCVIATLVLELHGTHPAVFAEAMAFFEVMTSYSHLLPSPAKQVFYSENPLFSCIPEILETLSPDRPCILSSHAGYSSPSFVKLRAAIYASMSLSSRNIFAVEWTDMKIVSLSLSALDFVCASCRFPLAEVTRSLATCREVEEFFSMKAVLAVELSSAVVTFFSSVQILKSDEPHMYLRWILLCRAILAGSAANSSTTNFDECDPYARLSVIRAANSQASVDFAPIADTVSHVRWQVKFVASTLLLQVIRYFKQLCTKMEPNFQQNAQFEFHVADAEFRKAKESGLHIPRSKLVFHLEDLLACACMNSVATVDHAELFPIQEVSIRWLNEMIISFCEIPDPDEPHSLILEQYLTQISSAVKHALSMHEECQTSGARRLFLAGCEAVHTMISKNLTSDPLVMKRLLRPTMLLNVPHFRFGDSYPKGIHAPLNKKDLPETHSALLPVIGKLWTSGKLLVTITNPCLGKIAEELIKNKLGLAIHSAAAAIDGARLLNQFSVSLSGLVLSDYQIASDFNFFLFESPEMIDNSVKESLAKYWSSLATCSLTPILTELSLDDITADTKDICLSWIRVLVPMLVQGSIDAISALENGIRVGTPVTTVSWATSLDPSDILVNCLIGLSLIVGADANYADYGENLRLDHVVDRLREVIIVYLLENASNDEDEEQIQEFDERVILETCKLLLALSSTTSQFLTKDAPLMAAILLPLKYVQDGQFTLQSTPIMDIVTSSISSSSALIRNGRASDTFIKTMLQFVVNDVLQSTSKSIFNRQSMMIAATSLVRACVEYKGIPLYQRSRMATEFVANGNWDAWEATVPVEDGRVVAASLKIVKDKLMDFKSSVLQLTALSSLRNTLQNPSLTSELCGFLFHELGAEVITILKECGSHKGLGINETIRSEMFANSMKILLIAYHRLAGEGGDEGMSTFLALFFEVQLAAVRCNGLPNHPSTTPGGNPVLGRMCAQSILHVAKTTPLPFKGTVSNLAEHDRALLEFAVRAEMSGYAGASSHVQEQSKKKLNLQGFKK